MTVQESFFGIGRRRGTVKISLKTVNNNLNMSWLQYVPTSQALALLSQSRLLNHHLSCKYEVKKAAQLNYVVIRGNQ